MTVKFKDYDLQVTFLYIRRKPNKEDILKIQENCEGSIIILGDLNLNPLNESDHKLLTLLSGKEKRLFLTE